MLEHCGYQHYLERDKPGATLGTIVFFSGGGGEAAATFPGEEQAFIPGYVSANYQVVQTSWASDWENTNTGTSTTYPFNIRTAACRPASFLAYAYANIYPASQNPQAGMCAQGASAGSAAIAYSLAWYNAASFIDKVEMLVGPPLSDLKQGCQVPNNNYILMCRNQQLGCNGWAVTDPPGYSLEYTDHKDAVEGWSGGIAVTGPACAGTTGPTTNDANWLHMSLVDLSGYSGNPSFSYPQTAMGAWLCENDTEGTMNNAGSQGEIFYQQFTQQSQIHWPDYLLNAVTGCHNAEGVPYGTPPPNWVALGLTPAAEAISFDMSNQTWPSRCLKRH